MYPARGAWIGDFPGAVHSITCSILYKWFVTNNIQLRSNLRIQISKSKKPIPQFPSNRPNVPKGKVKGRLNRDLGSHQKEQWRASNVMVKFVSQNAPTGVQPCHSGHMTVVNGRRSRSRSLDRSEDRRPAGRKVTVAEAVNR